MSLLSKLRRDEVVRRLRRAIPHPISLRYRNALTNRPTQKGNDMTAEFNQHEFDNTLCPLCGDIMTSAHSNLTPVWNEQADDITCWWCLHHHAPALP